MTETTDNRFRGNDFISGSAQARYYQIREEMKNRPEIAKLLLINPSDSGWLEIIAILEFLQLRIMEGSQ